MDKEHIKTRLLQIITDYKELLNKKRLLSFDLKDNQIAVEAKKADIVSGNKRFTGKTQDALATINTIPEIVEMNRIQKDIFSVDVDIDILMNEEKILLALLTI